MVSDIKKVQVGVSCFTEIVLNKNKIVKTSPKKKQKTKKKKKLLLKENIYTVSYDENSQFVIKDDDDNSIPF